MKFADQTTPSFIQPLEDGGSVLVVNNLTGDGLPGASKDETFFAIEAIEAALCV